MTNTLEDIIKLHVPLLVENRNSWYATRCQVCDDHMPGSPNFKGLRGNFNLQGNVIGYNCYNCDHRAKFDINESSKYSNNMTKVFESFDIPETEYNQILLSHFGEAKTPSTKSAISHEPEHVKLPEHFYYLKDANPNDKWSIIAHHYLETRKIDSTLHKFMLSTGQGKGANKWKGRLIIPYFKDNHLIYYQGRALLDSMKKYENPTTDKSKVLYNFDQIFTYSKSPIFVTEGFFDAILVNGVALFGKNISKSQAYWLNKSKRDKVIIPDKFGDGFRLVEQAYDLGWGVTFPNFPNCKDVNDAFIKYGKIYMFNEILNNIVFDQSLLLKGRLYCK